MPSTFCITITDFDQYPPSQQSYVVRELRSHGMVVTSTNRGRDIVLEGHRRFLPLVCFMLTALEYEVIGVTGNACTALNKAADAYTNWAV